MQGGPAEMHRLCMLMNQSIFLNVSIFRAQYLNLKIF